MNIPGVDEDILTDENVLDDEKTIDEEMVLDPEEKSHVGDWIEDSSVPRGWKYKFSLINKNILVKDSSGKKFNGRRPAILHLLKTNQDLKFIEVLDKGLAMEGWSSEQSLPSGWKYKKTKNLKHKYLSSSYEVIPSHSHALEFAKNNLDEEALTRLQQWIQNLSKTNRSSTTAASEVDETLPAGWRSQSLPSAGISLFTSPEGRQFSSRLAALRHLVEVGAQEKAVEEMRQFLYYEQWEVDHDLPPAWRMKKNGGDITLLTEQCEVLDSFTEAATRLRDEESLVRLNSLKVRLEGRGQTHTVPPGWSADGGGHAVSITAPDGTVFRSRRSALENMILSGKYHRSDIELMRTFLKFENWTERSDLPAGWRMKRGKRNVLMASDGKLFESFVQAAEFVNRYSPYFDQEVKEKILKLVSSPEVQSRNRNNRRRGLHGDSWTSDQTLPEGWLQKIVKIGEKKSFQYLLSHDGQKFRGKRSVLQHMIKNNYSQVDIMKIRSSLKHDGWDYHQNLPENWMYKLRGQRLLFCSSEGKLLETREKALVHIRSNGTDSDFEALKSFSICEGPVERKSSPLSIDDSWSEDESLPKGWKSKNHKIFQLMDPQGNKFKFRRHALKHLIDNSGLKEDIKTLRESLKCEGWRDTARLPEDWLFKTDKNSRQLKFVTERGDLVLNKIRAREYLEKHSATAEDLEKIKDIKYNVDQEQKIVKETKVETEIVPVSALIYRSSKVMKMLKSVRGISVVDKKLSKSLALNESSSMDCEISLDNPEVSFQTNEEEYYDEEDGVFTDRDDDEVFLK